MKKDTVTSEKAVIGREDYERILKMLDSSDQGDCSIGLTCIENSSHDQSIVHILLLRMNSVLAGEVWEKEAPKVSKKLKSLGVAMNAPLTLNTLFQSVLPKAGISEEDTQPILDHFGNFLLTHIADMGGYEFVKRLQMKVTFKDANNG